MDPLAADVASGQEGKELVVEEEDKLTFWIEWSVKFILT